MVFRDVVQIGSSGHTFLALSKEEVYCRHCIFARKQACRAAGLEQPLMSLSGPRHLQSPDGKDGVELVFAGRSSFNFTLLVVISISPDTRRLTTKMPCAMQWPETTWIFPIYVHPGHVSTISHSKMRTHVPTIPLLYAQPLLSRQADFRFSSVAAACEALWCRPSTGAANFRCCKFRTNLLDQS